MRYSLLNFVVCPRCLGELTAVTAAEAACKVSPVGLAPCARVSPAGASVGPLPSSGQETDLTEALRALAAAPAPPERNYEVVVETGALTCGACGSWYPVIGCIPELLPDHLRDWGRDRQWLESVAGEFPPSILECWRRFRPEPGADEAGANHKRAEIALPSKITDLSFWGPGYVSPFNPGTPDHTWHLIRNLAVAEPLLEMVRGQVVLDVGCGYSWTAEWFLRGGYEPVGLDLCRAYLEIALVRVGANRPHLLVGDAEHLPIRSTAVHAVLGFEAFHHIPNRAAAMREFHRVLTDGRPIVLVEPGGLHEHATGSVEAMEKYGTLEVGMELSDVAEYARDSGLTECRQQEVLRRTTAFPAQVPAGNRLLGTTPLIANNIYTLRKAAPPSDPPAAPVPKRSLLRRVLGPVLRPLYVRIPGWARRA